MSWILRHCQEPRFIDLNGGWASVNTILAALNKKYPDVTIKTIEQIVADDEKGRYSFDSTGTKIRANQGHSIPDVVIEMEAPEPPELLYHGTATRFFGYDNERRTKADDAAVCSHLARLRNGGQSRQQTRQAGCTENPRKGICK
jgi:putative RNA 2'-phosphotransferase